MFIGGHMAIRSQVAEDLRLAALAGRHRMRVGIARAQGLGHARMYAGYSGIRAGIERQSFRFMLVSPWMGVMILLAALSLALWLPALAWLAVNRQWIAAMAFALLPSLLLRFWYRSLARALLAPLAIYGLLPILARSLVSALAGKPITWKGRTFRAVS